MIKKKINNQFFDVLSYNGIVVFLKLFSSFIISKISAIYLGPSGYALLGNFRNVLQGLLGITSSGFESGVIKYISENKANTEGFKKVVINVFALNLCICLCISPFLFFFAGKLAIYTLKDISFLFVFKYLAFLLPLISFSFLVIYIVNGLQKFKIYTILLCVSNLLNALLTFVFIHLFNLKGALMASMLIPVLNFIIAFLFRDIRHLLVSALSELKLISLRFFKSISVYLFMALYSSILISLSYLFIRNSIINNINLKTAGLWEAINKVSTFYIIFFSSLMTLYLLPKLSENKTIKGYYNIMNDYFKIILPIIVLGFLLIYFLRVFIIKLFLTKEFIAIQSYFYLQLIGDFFKIIGFSLAYQFHAKKIVFSYVVTDAILYGIFYFLSIFLIDIFNLNGVFYAYVSSTFLYLIFVLFFVYKTRYKYLYADNE